MATTKWLRLQIISSTPCLKKTKNKHKKSSILADDATLLFHLGTDMTGVCVCAVFCQDMEQQEVTIC